MQNKIIVAVVLILALAFVYWYFVKTPTLSSEDQLATEIEDSALQSVSAAAVDTGAVVAGSVEKTNPFDAKVNPYDGYKNPFSE